MNEPTAVSDPRIGSVLQERYRIIERLAAGGMGMVYRGERLEVGKPVAIKFLHAWAARDEDFRKRFQVEARAMSRLTHPCCVSVIDFGMDQESPYMVMDFVTGDTLRGLLGDGALPPPRALGAVRQVLAGLAHAHAQGIIHRDIKPENIIVTHAVGLGEQVRILDFGLAKLRDEVTGLTSGMMLGTPSYMAPEQIHGEPVGPPTDLYATGVLLYELLTGKKPFNASSNAELLRMQREVPPPRLRDTAPDAGFSAELEATLAKAMEKAPENRFQSATEFLAALEGAWSGPAASPTAPVAGDAPGVPRSSSPTPSRPREEVLATRNVRAQPRGTPVDLQAESRALESPQATPTEAVARKEESEATIQSRPITPPPGGSRSRRVVGGAAVLSLAVAGLGWWALASRSADPAPVASEPPSPRAPAAEEARAEAPTGATDWQPVVEQLPGIDEAHRLIKAQRRDAALAALKKLAAKYPTSAYVRYLEGNVNFDNLRWVDGVTAYRTALRNDAAYRNAPVVIQNAIRCLVSDRFHGTCEDFLRKDLGEAAVPSLEDAAREHPMASVRTRAAALLRQRDRGFTDGSR
ncbi:serine/threonine protein kinase [Corallococcus sp. AB045]|uniref:serine/threonine-protein kinase n=1 Tax=Corallococcus sp. AB045 TaxID=2316719 RepID=UPI000ED4BD5B|nr:serine/threonine-protein kinase [Corallococcus sp. AB045]RKH88608.1 serine/threonine protein kinase [Corallococcus sp. AB045]